MPKIAYAAKHFRPASLTMIALADRIIGEYRAQGYMLTLRQLYYQFVARDLIPNTVQSYNRLQAIVSDARKAGFIDWLAIEDRTRAPESVSHWGEPAEIIDDSAEDYRIDKWIAQPQRVEVWIEKDALVGVIEDVCVELDVTYYSCRGYSSDPPVWNAARRFNNYTRGSAGGPKQGTTVFYFGDHDPSGLDMTRDLRARLALFGSRATVLRVALTMDQIDHFKPPPNPAKITDSRYAGYVAEHGGQSWELDALEPAVIVGLVRAHVEAARHEGLWDQAIDRENRDRELLSLISDRFDDVVRFLQSEGK